MPSSDRASLTSTPWSSARAREVPPPPTTSLATASTCSWSTRPRSPGEGVRRRPHAPRGGPAAAARDRHRRSAVRTTRGSPDLLAPRDARAARGRTSTTFPDLRPGDDAVRVRRAARAKRREGRRAAHGADRGDRARSRRTAGSPARGSRRGRRGARGPGPVRDRGRRRLVAVRVAGRRAARPDEAARHRGAPLLPHRPPSGALARGLDGPAGRRGRDHAGLRMAVRARPTAR